MQMTADSFGEPQSPPKRPAAALLGLGVVGVVASAALFGDPIGPLLGLGVAFVLGGLALASSPGPR